MNLPLKGWWNKSGHIRTVECGEERAGDEGYRGLTVRWPCGGCFSHYPPGRITVISLGWRAVANVVLIGVNCK